ncbi:hypothetical protein OCU04_002305 [Sclerotinia nivalis]|uniref:Uncharacterized protein n=1 Tax=Sclerotinia nivalis TaxID=352851 RepID=A0A9X0DNX2_9HELO|nr:hypothetical protein OCU04_002305 [Sclerotinia nivalis]
MVEQPALLKTDLNISGGIECIASKSPRDQPEDTYSLLSSAPQAVIVMYLDACLSELPRYLESQKESMITKL